MTAVPISTAMAIGAYFLARRWLRAPRRTAAAGAAALLAVWVAGDFHLIPVPMNAAASFILGVAIVRDCMRR